MLSGAALSFFSLLLYSPGVSLSVSLSIMAVSILLSRSVLAAALILSALCYLTGRPGPTFLNTLKGKKIRTRWVGGG